MAFREAGYALQLAEQQDAARRASAPTSTSGTPSGPCTSGAVERGLEKLREQGHLFEDDGALWLRTTDFGDDKDRVLRHGNGELTYFASDTAYYVDKRERGFDVCIYLLGADHHGYVGRLKAMAACAGDDPERNIEVLIGQLVKIMQGGEEVRLSKRAGNMVTLEELVDEIGVDAARYTLSRYPADSPLTLDVDADHPAGHDNPVFYVQYAHARIASIAAQRAPTSGSTAPGALRPVAAQPRAGGRAARRAGRVPARRRDGRRAARAAPGRALPRGHRAAATTSSTTSAGCCRWATRSRHRSTPRGCCCVDATQTVSPTACDLLGVTAPERM